MKKAILIIVLLIFWSNASFAYYLDPLPKKTGTENNLYNEWIKAYNEFKHEWHSEVYEYCKDQMITGAGFQQLVQQTRCEYDATVDLAQRHKVYIKEFVTIIHSWHENAFEMSKVAAISLLRRYSDQVLRDSIESKMHLDRRLMRDLDRAIQAEATRNNADYLAKKKKEKSRKAFYSKYK